MDENYDDDFKIYWWVWVWVWVCVCVSMNIILDGLIGIGWDQITGKRNSRIAGEQEWEEEQYYLTTLLPVLPVLPVVKESCQ